jgi:hypothetical protein
VVIPPATLGQPRTHECSVAVHDDPNDRPLRASVLPDRLDLDLTLAVEQAERFLIEGWPILGGGQ